MSATILSIDLGKFNSIHGAYAAYSGPYCCDSPLPVSSSRCASPAGSRPGDRGNIRSRATIRWRWRGYHPMPYAEWREKRPRR